MVAKYPVADNLVLNTYYRRPFAHGIILNYRAIEEHAWRLVHEFDIRTPSVYVPASNLSGGNQQKMIVAREFSRPIKLLIAAQPTRGLDVGSIEFIHKRLIQARDQGVAVLLVSAELDEIMSLADRIAVMYKGRIVATVEAERADRAGLGLLMAGITSHTALETVR
jgi:simple sugar transport system ATP-binding protein